MVNRKYTYKCSRGFENAIGLLSIAGYYLSGYIDNHRDFYQVYKRYGETKNCVATLHRDGRIIIYSSKIKKDIIKALNKRPSSRNTKNDSPSDLDGILGLDPED